MKPFWAFTPLDKSWIDRYLCANSYFSLQCFAVFCLGSSFEHQCSFRIKLDIFKLIIVDLHLFTFSYWLYLDTLHFNKKASSNPLIQSWIGQVTTMKCAVYANPPANLTWFKAGRAIMDGANSTHDKSTLTLTPKTADDFGMYSCSATNSKGTASYHITVEQLRKWIDKCNTAQAF